MLDTHVVSVPEVSYMLLEAQKSSNTGPTYRPSARTPYTDLGEHLRTIPGLVEHEVSRIGK